MTGDFQRHQRLLSLTWVEAGVPLDLSAIDLVFPWNEEQDVADQQDKHSNGNAHHYPFNRVERKTDKAASKRECRRRKQHSQVTEKCSLWADFVSKKSRPADDDSNESRWQK
jgi:hypothetical protein